MIPKIVEKSFQNPPKTLPKPFKIEQNSKKIYEKTNMSEDNPKMRKKCEKLRKNSPTWPQEPPKREGIICAAVSALPCLAPNLESKKH